MPRKPVRSAARQVSSRNPSGIAPYRCSGSPNAEGSLAAFPDYANVSEYAVDAMVWATGTGLINGIAGDGTTILSPKTNASRAQIASIIMRFAEG